MNLDIVEAQIKHLAEVQPEAARAFTEVLRRLCQAEEALIYYAGATISIQDNDTWIKANPRIAEMHLARWKEP